MNPNQPKKIILDTDPGGDDIFALLWLMSLAHQGAAEIVAITSAEGNVRAELTFQAASQILALGGFPDVPLGRGVPVPQKHFADAAHIHGEDGMGGLSKTLPPLDRSFEEAPPSPQLLISKLQEAPGEISILAIAPLTNLAMAETLHPGILKLAREIIIMGGAFHTPGNVTPWAEFNIAFNPQAAHTVFTSGNDIVVLPLNLTRQLIFTPEQMHAIIEVNPGSAIAQFIHPLSQFLTQTSLQYRETKGKIGFLVHDALTLAYTFYPEILKFSREIVYVETLGLYCLGQTLVDRRHQFKPQANAWLAQEVAVVEFFALLGEDLKNLLKTPT